MRRTGTTRLFSPCLKVRPNYLRANFCSTRSWMPPNFCHHILQDAGTGNARGRSAASPAHAPCNPNFKNAAGLQHPTQKFTSPHYYDVDSSYYGGALVLKADTTEPSWRTITA